MNFIRKIYENLPNVILTIISLFIPRLRKGVVRIKLKRFTIKLYKKPALLNKVIHNKKPTIMEITDLKWKQSFINCYIVNDIISLMVYSLFKGCIPRVSVNNKGIDDYKWEWLFKQPANIFGIEDGHAVVIKCDLLEPLYGINYNVVYNKNSIEFKAWSYIYNLLIKKSDTFENYCKLDLINNSIVPNNSLGILIRGTDYIRLRPKGHPIVPTPYEIIDYINSHINVSKHLYFYIATEDKSLFNVFLDKYGNTSVKQNTRVYYDEKYKDIGREGIIKVCFDRENDNLKRTLEYFSSLFILVECKSFVAANCYGTLFVSLLRGQYDSYVFDKGRY